LREDEVTEQAIVDALKQPPVMVEKEGPATGGTRKRGFAPPRVDPAPKAAPQRTASMLITFATDSAILTSGARAALDKVARALSAPELAGARFSIEGHADPRGDEEYNLRLSRQRADSVVTYLVRERSIPGERLEALGKGSSELMNRAVPAAPENRRVTIVVRAGV
jgi:outer membrane protein OmpA-like peptidoglycan-associated protein